MCSATLAELISNLHTRIDTLLPSTNKFILTLSYLLNKEHNSWPIIGANDMTTINDVHSSSESLLQQLEGWKCIASANRDILINQNPFLVEFLAFKLDIAQGYIEELHFWEEVANQSKCQNAIENTQFFLGQVKVLMDRVICEQQKKVLIDSQNELSFTIRVSTSHEHVLHESIKIFALTA